MEVQHRQNQVAEVQTTKWQPLILDSIHKTQSSNFPIEEEHLCGFWFSYKEQER